MMLSELVKQAQDILDEYGDRPVKDFETGFPVTNIFMSADDIEQEKQGRGFKAAALIDIDFT
jgi:hypothetical protein